MEYVGTTQHEVRTAVAHAARNAYNCVCDALALPMTPCLRSTLLDASSALSKIAHLDAEDRSAWADAMDTLLSAASALESVGRRSMLRSVEVQSSIDSAHDWLAVALRDASLIRQVQDTGLDLPLAG